MAVSLTEGLMMLGELAVDLAPLPPDLYDELVPRRAHLQVYQGEKLLVTYLILRRTPRSTGTKLIARNLDWRMGDGTDGPTIEFREFISGRNKLPNPDWSLGDLYWSRDQDTAWALSPGLAVVTNTGPTDDPLAPDWTWLARPGDLYRLTGNWTRTSGSVGLLRARIVCSGRYKHPNLWFNGDLALGPAGWTGGTHLSVVSDPANAYSGSNVIRLDPIPQPNLEPNPTFAAGWTLGPDMAVTAAGLVLSSNTRLQLMSDLEAGNWDATAPDVGVVLDPAHAWMPGSLGNYVAKIGPNVKHQVFKNADFEGASTPVQPFLWVNGKPPTALRAAAGMRMNGRRHAVRRPVTDPRALAAMAELARQPVPSVPRAAAARALSGKTKTATTVRRYLARFGYLPAETLSLAATERTDLDDELAGGLRRYQRFFGLRETGKVDEATVEMMGRPRCGYPDLPPTFPSLADVRAYVPAPGGPWADRSLTYGFSAYVADITSAQQETAMVDAFNQWSFAAPDLSFTLVPIATTPQIIIGVDSNPSGNLAYAWFPSGGGDINFYDTQWNWGINPGVGGGSSDFDYGRVATHEIGHALGLDHTDVATAIMWPTVNPGNQANALDPDDAAGILYLYPTGAPPPDPPPGPSPAPPAGGGDGLDYWFQSSSAATPDLRWYSDPAGGVNGSDAATTMGTAGGPLIKYLRADKTNGGPGVEAYDVKPGESYEAESYVRKAPSTSGYFYISIMIPHPTNPVHDIWHTSTHVESDKTADDQWQVVKINGISIPGTRTKVNGLLEAHDHFAGYWAADNFILTRTKGNRRTIYSATALTFVPGTQYRISGIVIAGDNHMAGDANWGVKLTNGTPAQDTEITVSQGNKDFEWAHAHGDFTPEPGYTSGLPFISAIDVDGDSIYLDYFRITRWTNNISTAYGTAFPVTEDQNYQLRSIVTSNAGALQGKATVGYILSGPGMDDEIVSEDVALTLGQAKSVTKDVKPKAGYTTARGFVRSIDINGNGATPATFTVTRLDFIKVDNNSDFITGGLMPVTPEREYAGVVKVRAGAGVKRGSVGLALDCYGPSRPNIVIDTPSLSVTDAIGAEWIDLPFTVSTPSGYASIVPRVVSTDLDSGEVFLGYFSLIDNDPSTLVTDAVVGGTGSGTFTLDLTVPDGTDTVGMALVGENQAAYSVGGVDLHRRETPSTTGDVFRALLNDPDTGLPLMAPGRVYGGDIIQFDWTVRNLGLRAALDRLCRAGVALPLREWRVHPDNTVDFGTAEEIYTDHAPGTPESFVVAFPNDMTILDEPSVEEMEEDLLTELTVVGAEKTGPSGVPFHITGVATDPADGALDFYGRPYSRRRTVTDTTADHPVYATALARHLLDVANARNPTSAIALADWRTLGDFTSGDWIYPWAKDVMEGTEPITHKGRTIAPARRRAQQRRWELGGSPFRLVIRRADGTTQDVPDRLVQWSSSTTAAVDLGDVLVDVDTDEQGGPAGIQFLRQQASDPGTR